MISSKVVNLHDFLIPSHYGALIVGFDMRNSQEKVNFFAWFI